MKKSLITYEEKFVAFVDILGFKSLIENSVSANDAVSIARMIKRLGSDNDTTLYREDGAEICPDSKKHRDDLGFRISQVSDCVVVSAEVSPAGAINIVNYCRKIAERLLLRERVLCQGYLTSGKICHEGMMFFGPGYQRAWDGVQNAAAIKWEPGVLGTPFIEVDPAVSSYLDANGDACTKNQFVRMTISRDTYLVISPYGIFDRMIEWAIDPANKSVDDMHREIESARNLVGKIESDLSASKPINDRGREKLRISLEKLSEARAKLAQADEDIDFLSSPFPAR
jgi:hypothetical protein